MSINANPVVDTFLNHLNHKQLDAIRFIRDIILDIGDHVTENIKRNAPSFGLDVGDGITFRLQLGDRLVLLFHRGGEGIKDEFEFDDPGGLLVWRTGEWSVSQI